MYGRIKPVKEQQIKDAKERWDDGRRAKRIRYPTRKYRLPDRPRATLRRGRRVPAAQAAQQPAQQVPDVQNPPDPVDDDRQRDAASPDPPEALPDRHRARREPSRSSTSSSGRDTAPEPQPKRRRIDGCAARAQNSPSSNVRPRRAPSTRANSVESGEEELPARRPSHELQRLPLVENAQRMRRPPLRRNTIESQPKTPGRENSPPAN